MMPLLLGPAQGSGARPIPPEGEVLMAFLDDIHTVGPPDRVGAIHKMLARALWSEAGIRVHQGKTQIWRCLTGAKPSRLRRCCPIRQLLCGEGLKSSQHTVVGCLVLSALIWRRPQGTTKCSLTVSHSSRMFSQHGCSWCIAQWWNPEQWRIPVALTTNSVANSLLASCSGGSRVSQPAHWASWADSLVVIGQRHPTVASKLVRELEGPPRHS